MTMGPAHADLTDRYQRQRLKLSEEMYGEGFQSTGGTKLLRRAVSRMSLQTGDRVLDLGCGTGGALRFMAEQYGVGGTGLDGSADCIALANETSATHLGLDFVQADFRDLPLEGTYDAFWTCQAVCYFPDKVSLFRRILPHLAPERVSVLVDYFVGTPSPSFHAYAKDCGFALLSEEEFVQTLTGAGFVVTQVEDYTSWFLAAMEGEIAQLKAKRSSFLERYQQADFEHLCVRWGKKAEFCREGALRTLIVSVQVP